MFLTPTLDYSMNKVLLHWGVQNVPLTKEGVGAVILGDEFQSYVKPLHMTANKTTYTVNVYKQMSQLPPVDKAYMVAGSNQM